MVILYRKRECTFYHPPEHFKVADELNEKGRPFRYLTGRIDYHRAKRPPNHERSPSPNVHSSDLHEDRHFHRKKSWDRNRDRERARDRDRSRDRSRRREWGRNSRKSPGKRRHGDHHRKEPRDNPPFSPEEEDKLIDYVRAHHPELATSIPSSHYPKLTALFGRGLWNIKANFFRLKDLGRFNVGDEPLNPQINHSHGLHVDPQLGALQPQVVIQSPSVPHSHVESSHSLSPRPWSESEMDQLVSILVTKHKIRNSIPSEILGEVELALNRSTKDIMMMFLRLRSEGRIPSKKRKREKAEKRNQSRKREPVPNGNVMDFSFANSLNEFNPHSLGNVAIPVVPPPPPPHPDSAHGLSTVPALKFVEVNGPVESQRNGFAVQNGEINQNVNAKNNLTAHNYGSHYVAHPAGHVGGHPGGQPLNNYTEPVAKKRKLIDPRIARMRSNDQNNKEIVEKNQPDEFQMALAGASDYGSTTNSTANGSLGSNSADMNRNYHMTGNDNEIKRPTDTNHDARNGYGQVGKRLTVLSVPGTDPSRTGQSDPNRIGAFGKRTYSEMAITPAAESGVDQRKRQRQNEMHGVHGENSDNAERKQMSTMKHGRGQMSSANNEGQKYKIGQHDELYFMVDTLQNEYSRGLQLLNGMRQHERDEQREEYKQLLLRQIEAIKASNHEMHQYQNRNSRLMGANAGAGEKEIVGSNHVRGHVRK